MAGNLSIEQRKWILKQYWKTESALMDFFFWGVVKNKFYERNP